MNKRLATFFVILAGVLWGIISIFVRALSGCRFSGAQICFLRVLTGAVLMLVFLLLYDRRLLRFELRDVWMFLGTGIISLTLFSYCYFTTILNTEASIAVSLLYTSPVFIMLFSAVLFRERITPMRLLAGVLTVAGCALVSGMVGSSVPLRPVSLLIGLGSGLFYALYSVFGRYAARRYHPFTITFYTFVFASLGFLLFAEPIDTFRVLAAAPDAAVYVLLMGILCGILPYIFYTAGLKHLDATVAGILVAVEPLVGCVIGLTIFRESADPLKLLGIGMILLSIVLLSLRPDSGKQDSTGGS